MNLEPIIGLEFHVQLKTKTKMFCACRNEADFSNPNENICPICLGHPGTLPAINVEALQMAKKVALALNCNIAEFTKFDRKNYFYPDLPKGYQISQYDEPLATKGYLVINNQARDGLAGRLDKENDLKKIDIIRLHMEEDSAKSTHEEDSSLIDYNRGGAPLIEIVSAPHMSSPQEAKTFAQEIQLIMRYLNVSDADMEKGHLRCDANISLRPHGDHELYPKTEIKNINSFRALEKALAYEIERQTLLWATGRQPDAQETRGWDDNKQKTILQRVKEAENDYRYFPEPDLPPILIASEEIQEIKNLLPELPQTKRKRFMEMYDFSGEDTKILTENKKLANYTEEIISELMDWLHALENKDGEKVWEENKRKLNKLVSNWLINKLLPLLGEMKISLEQNKITAENFAEFITLIFENKLNSSSAQIILKEMARTGGDPSNIMDDKKLEQTDSNEGLTEIIQAIITNNPKQAEEFRAGKEPLIKFFIGLVMRETKGASNPDMIEKELRRLLKLFL